MKLAATIALTLLVTLPARADEAPEAVRGALADSLAAALPGARLELAGWKINAKGCTPTGAEVERPVNASGRYAVRLSGEGCGVWGWANVRVFAPAFVTTRPVRIGDALAGAVKASEKEVRAGRVPASVAGNAKATRALGTGQLVEAAHVEAGGPPAGSPIKVVVRTGALVLTQNGRVVGCGRGRTCAVLPSGKHVEGTFAGDVLLVEVQ